ncbi:extracellular solute-binding protein [Micromonospora narathiwatensis]|uniref:Multiple sugar transport system substrate-binding protein n=1 Tax=Micromonospora narathiwatensis TaxID=299146 RepID=A0A1A8ZQU0_9ACTN|nr:extracellular solute-binding protein [Micromonospora narathiwatensis]SBT46489.1 multiple sugar transport system substrate-binding protein [Micromonospora narathiwatensis]
MTGSAAGGNRQARTTAAWARRLFSGPFAWFTLGVLAMVAAASARSLIHHPPQEARSGELVILSGADESTGGQRQLLVDKWNLAHPDTPARLEKLSRSADEQHSEMVARAQSDNPNVDVYNLDVTWTAEFATAGYIRPLDDSVDTSGFLDAPLKTCQFDGKLWALPFNTDAGLLFYRKRVPPDALPATLPPRQNDVRALRDAEPTLQAGFVTPLAAYEGLTVSALEAIWAAQGDVYDAEKDLVVIDSEQAHAGLQRLAEAMKPVGDLPPAVDPRSNDFREDTSRAAFQRGEVPLMRNWPVAYGQLRTGDRPMTDFDVTPLPGRSVLGGQNLAVATSTRNPRVAQELVTFLTSEESERALFRNGGLAATRATVYDDPQVRLVRPYAPTLRQALSKARPRPVTPHYALFSSTFQEIVTEALSNGGNLPDDAVKRLTDALHGRVS